MTLGFPSTVGHTRLLQALARDHIPLKTWSSYLGRRPPVEASHLTEHHHGLQPATDAASPPTSVHTARPSLPP